MRNPCQVSHVDSSLVFASPDEGASTPMATVARMARSLASRARVEWQSGMRPDPQPGRRGARLPDVGATRLRATRATHDVAPYARCSGAATVDRTACR